MVRCLPKLLLIICLSSLCLVAYFLMRSNDAPILDYNQRCDLNVEDPGERQLPEASWVFTVRDKRKPAIFFLETSCYGHVNARQACAVESAARLHPHSDVYLVILSPPSSLDVTTDVVLSNLKRHNKNVHILYTHLNQLIRHSPLEEWLTKGDLRRSRHQISHTSDVLRYLILWKYGGTYLDLDVVLIKSLVNITNFVGAESSEDLAVGVLKFELSYSQVALECVKEIRDHFRGDDWSNNGPGIITRVFKNLCRTSNITDMTREKCSGFTVLPPEMFYPIPWREWKAYFSDEDSNATMARLSQSLAIHVWNKFSVNHKLRVGSQQPYALVAERSCPNIYWNSGPEF